MKSAEGGEVAAPAAAWWRATRYGIVDGTHIRPVMGAPIKTYDAVGRYNEFLIGDGVARDAYVALLNLDLNDNTKVLRWCSRFGLLGILHHQLVAAYLWPTWRDRLLSGLNRQHPHQIVLAEAEAFDRFPRRVAYDEKISRAHNPNEVNTLLTDPELHSVLNSQESSTIRQPRALVRNLWSFTHDDVDLVEGYGQFFPDVEGVSAFAAEQTPKPGSLPWAPPACAEARELIQRPRSELNRAHYPQPDSVEFLSRYAEPRYLFHRIAHEFQAAVEFLANQADDEHFTRASVRLHGYQVPRQLMAALREVSPSITWHEDGWSHSWEVRSLLAAMSVMVVQDITLLDGRLPRCPQCGDRFFTDRSDAKYCTPACGNAFRVARHRRNEHASPITELAAEESAS